MQKKTLFMFAVMSAVCIGAEAAETIWKVKRPDGTYEFGNGSAMPPGAVRIETGKTPQNVLPVPSYPTQNYVSPSRNDTPSSSDRQRDNLRSLREQAEAAKQAMTDGEEPLPGERTGNAGGGSRLNEDYFARQERLKEAYRNAKDAYDAALTQAGKNR